MESESLGGFQPEPPEARRGRMELRAFCVFLVIQDADAHAFMAGISADPLALFLGGVDILWMC